MESRLEGVFTSLRPVWNRRTARAHNPRLSCPWRISLAALVAGCIPVYLGPPDITPFLPHPDAALVYQDAQQTSDEMLRLINDTADYERRVRMLSSAL